MVGHLCLLHEVFNALRYLVWAGCPWRGLPHDLPSWEMVYQQSQRWIMAGVFETMCHDLRVLRHLVAGRTADPTAAIFATKLPACSSYCTSTF